MYRTFNDQCREKFGCKVYKLSIDAGFSCLSLEEYGLWLKSCIDILPPHIVVHRITGDGAKKDLIAPVWSGDKKRVINYLNCILR